MKLHQTTIAGFYYHLYKTILQRIHTQNLDVQQHIVYWFYLVQYLHEPFLSDEGGVCPLVYPDADAERWSANEYEGHSKCFQPTLQLLT